MMHEVELDLWRIRHPALRRLISNAQSDSWQFAQTKAIRSGNIEGLQTIRDHHAPGALAVRPKSPEKRIAAMVKLRAERDIGANRAAVAARNFRDSIRDLNDAAGLVLPDSLAGRSSIAQKKIVI